MVVLIFVCIFDSVLLLNLLVWLRWWNLVSYWFSLFRLLVIMLNMLLVVLCGIFCFRWVMCIFCCMWILLLLGLWLLDSSLSRVDLLVLLWLIRVICLFGLIDSLVFFSNSGLLMLKLMFCRVIRGI